MRRMRNAERPWRHSHAERGNDHNATHTAATPVNWRPGEDVIIPTSVSDEDARKKYPDGFKILKPYLRVVPQPK